MHVHSHAPVVRKLQLSLLVTVAFIAVEFAAGLTASSLSLLSDAAHNLADALALGLAWFAVFLQRKPPNPTKTFGYHRAGVLAAFLNAASLILLALFIFYESYERLLAPREVEEQIMIYVAAAGLVVNLVVMRALHADSKEDLNIRGAFMHMLGDALSSVGIIVGGLLIARTDWMWIDPVLSVLIGLLILWSGWNVVRESLNILLEGLPVGMSLEEVRGSLRDLDGVLDVHDLHVWSLSSSARALCCHVQIPDLPPSSSERILHRINAVLADRFRIQHTTVQFEHERCEHAQEICSELESVGRHA